MATHHSTPENKTVSCSSWPWTGLAQHGPSAAALLLAAWISTTLATARTRQCDAATESPDASYTQTMVIEPPAKRGRILGFCVATGGGLVAVTGEAEHYGAINRLPGLGKATPHSLVWFDAEGKDTQTVALDFNATVLAAAHSGGVYAAGDGVVALYSATGKPVLRAHSPQLQANDGGPAAFEKSVLQKHEAMLEGLDQEIARLREVVAQLEKKAEVTDESDSSEADADSGDHRRARNRKESQSQKARARTDMNRMTARLRKIESQADRLRNQEPQSLVDQALRKVRKVHAISATRDAVFVVTGENSGYGYAAWRFDDRLENPQMILSRLSGCCGQMDVQVCGDRLAIAANTKHCVELASFTGEILGRIGQRASNADDKAGFGGCCNPMNICPASDGSLLASESNGVIKRFDADGTFVEVVGKADVKGGCKNSAIAIEPDGSRLYYMDVRQGNVIVLTRATPPALNASDPDRHHP